MTEVDFEDPKEKFQDLVLSLRRTLVPIIVGFLLAQAMRAGFDIPADQLTGVVEALVTGAYYSIVRFVEMKYPGAGVMLGAMKAPTYVDKRAK